MHILLEILLSFSRIQINFELFLSEIVSPLENKKLLSYTLEYTEKVEQVHSRTDGYRRTDYYTMASEYINFMEMNTLNSD